MTMAMTQHDIELLREDKRREERRERSRRANLYGPVEGCDGDLEALTVPCAACGHRMPEDDATRVWTLGAYLPHCAACADDLWPDDIDGVLPGEDRRDEDGEREDE